MQDGKATPTGKMVLSFDLYHLPKTLDVAWYKVKVKPYFPNPMRCRNCQRLGHTKNRCSNAATCEGCNLPPHQPTTCTRDQCANCCDTHPSSDKNCPRFKQMKDVLQIKTIHKCSLGEAFKKYNLNNPPTDTSKRTYAISVKESETTSNNSIARKNDLKTTNCKSTTPTTDYLKRPASSPKTNQEKIAKTTASSYKHQHTINSESNSNYKGIHTENANPTNPSSSPLSNITQQLISNNHYFIPATETSSMQIDTATSSSS
ncbi:PREDICTED: uncharacterized protein LOC108356763 [Rhagoletis zephyria]|uniref:uncharacterized protein LOC108356763 n=1 Tax=Rhagoletis zephyria TaxID=28612 RepID=UPI0008115250|nr:PREDICTED: uncharacterized protein LOC108356763 [Rhagoletis zephyria]